MRFLPLAVVSVAGMCLLGAVDEAVVVPPTPFEKDFGAVPLGAVLNLDVSSPLGLTGSTAGGIWAGGSATFVPKIRFTANVPKDKGGVHIGTFSGKYKVAGSPGNGPGGDDPSWAGKAKDKSGAAVLLSLDSCEDVIVYACTVPGQVKLTLKGTPDYALLDVHRDVGKYTASFNYPSMPEGTFTSVDMVFTPDGGGSAINDTLPARFRNFGRMRHSQYNVPDENDATCQKGALVTVHVTDGPDAKGVCKWVDIDIYSLFQTRMRLNGTGISIASGMIGREYMCPDMPSPKYRKKSVVVGACNTPLTAGQTVAAELGGDFACGDRICIDPGGRKLRKIVQDNCPACAGKKQIDNFTGPGGCGVAVDLGNFITIKAY